MSEAGKDSMERFNEREEKLMAFARDKPLFSSKAITDFCLGFFDPIVGVLEHVKLKTKSYKKIQCVADGDKIGRHEIIDINTYKVFTEDVEANIYPPASINIEFLFQEPVYPIDEISTLIHVYFQKNKYVVVCISNKSVEIYRIEKTYMTYLEPTQIEELRDVLFEKIMDTISAKIDQLLGS